MTPRLPLMRATMVILLLVLQGCAALRPGWEQPVVNLASFRSVAAEGMTPAFEIDLRILNPNASDLRLNGIVYTVSIRGHDLVKGVGKDFPVIEAYSEAVVTLSASANILAGIRLFMELAQAEDGPSGVTYVLEAKLDLAGPYPSVRVREEFNPQTAAGEQAGPQT